MVNQEELKPGNKLLELFQEEQKKEFLVKEWIGKFVDSIRRDAKDIPISERELARLNELEQTLLDAYPSKLGSHEALHALFTIGVLIGRYTPTDEVKLLKTENELFKLKEYLRSYPFRVKKLAQDIIREIIQKQAVSAWNQEEFSDFKRIEIQDLIFEKVVENIKYQIKQIEDPEGQVIEAIKKAIPKRPSSMATAIREVAPKHAREPGPRKAK